MKLSPRLKAITKFIKYNSIVADIGTDHGYIPVYLIENNISKKVIASDVNEGPLNNAKAFITKKGFEEKIETRLGNGLKVLQPDEVDTVIIAGMGGTLIKNILDKSKRITETINNFIFQPMVDSYNLRKYLYENNYKIIDEKLVKEGERIYEIIYVEHGKDYLENEIYLLVGKKLIENKDPYAKEFIQNKIQKYEGIMKKVEKSKTVESKKKYEKLKRERDSLMEVIKWL
ncbi:tRNA (adenine(22)-N(1))-methyltransferase [Thermohalobacter berrensis]|uniref:SAM-dependent methyltransferase n=1 Tax=Thermohalobacter berrensis TaxID=99594 RepID=A0A419TB56_9FIRM|nr:class I SAM-dependent methyltransferase [Thermohalobacter berrensis]RKD34718.1 SAM-dependent methyltransferase [Thermohalobacter berrensis]